jgi:hypothetical protein
MANNALSLPLDLQPYANAVISTGGQTLANSNITYISGEDLYSTCALTVGAAGLISAQTVPIFSTALGNAGQGFTAALGRSETNMETNPFGGNDYYIATAVGFQLFMATSVSNPQPLLGYPNVQASTTALPLTAPDIQGLSEVLFWTYQLGGGPTRQRGFLGQYPFGAGVYTAGIVSINSANLFESVPQLGGPNVPVRAFDGDPLVFPPNIKVNINVANTTPFSIFNTTTSQVVAVRMNFRGYRLTIPV